MIICYVGTPGSGKTYEAVKTIVANLRRGRRVYTNIDGLEVESHRRFIQDQLNLDDYEMSKRLVFLEQEQVNRFWEIAKDGSMIVLDEVHKNFSNRDWSTERNKKFADWASTHRHHGFDVILITQDIEKVEKHVRSLIEWSYYFRKVNFLGSAVSQKYICYSYSGDDHNGKPLSKNIRTYNPLIFRCYKSYATDDAKEIGFMTHVNILKHPIFFLIPLVVVFGVYIFSKSSFASGDLFGSKKLTEKAKQMEHERKAKISSPSGSVKVPVQAPYSSPRAFPVASVSVPPVPLSSIAPPPVPQVQEDQAAIKSPGYIWTDKKGHVHLTNVKASIPSGVRYKELSW